MSTPAIRAPGVRDDALKKVVLLRRWSLVVATALTGLFATAAAAGNPGHAATAATSTSPTGQTAGAGSDGTDDGLQAPVVAPGAGNGGGSPVAVSGGS
jgi:hypothetical protein